MDPNLLALLMSKGGTMGIAPPEGNNPMQQQMMGVGSVLGQIGAALGKGGGGPMGDMAVAMGQVPQDQMKNYNTAKILSTMMGGGATPAPGTTPVTPAPQVQPSELKKPEPPSTSDLLSKVGDPSNGITGITLNPDGTPKTISGAYKPPELATSMNGGSAPAANPFQEALLKLYHQ